MASSLKRFKTRAFARPDVREAYEALGAEFAFLDEVLKARAEAGLTQAQVAERIVEPSPRSRALNPER